MFDILSAVYHDDPFSYQILCCLDNPASPEERHVAAQLGAVDEKSAEALKAGIEVLAAKQAERGFCSGVRFGAQLMKQLLEEPA